MGRLLNPGVGELIDRLSILRLKILHSTEHQTHFETEKAQISMLLDRMGLPTDEHLLQVCERLHLSNARLWQFEDQMAKYVRTQRQWDGTDPYVVAELGVEIWKMNRTRNAFIREINERAGTYTGPEKL